MTQPIPVWKVWHPLATWKVFAVLFVMQFVCMAPVVAMREGLGIGVPVWVGSGLAGALGWVVILLLGRRQAARDAEAAANAG